MMIVFGDTAAISITCVYINYYIKYKKSYIYIYIYITTTTTTTTTTTITITII